MRKRNKLRRVMALLMTALLLVTMSAEVLAAEADPGWAQVDKPAESGVPTEEDAKAETPELTRTPEAAEAPELTRTPEAAETPEPTRTPEATETPAPARTPEEKGVQETEAAEDILELFKGAESRDNGNARTSADGLTVEGGVPGQDYTYTNGVLKILTETPMTISNVVSKTSDRIEVALDTDATANLTLAGVSIDVRPAGEAAAMKVISGSLNLTLAENSVNILVSGKNYAGLQNGEHELLIRCENETQGHVCGLESCGRLLAVGGENGAGIGGGAGEDGSNITISGGVVGSASFNLGAGIGGGYQGDADHIVITGGSVSGYPFYEGVGIGGGSEGSTGSIRIVPANGMQMRVLTGADNNKKEPIDGSPFVSDTEISGLINGAKAVSIEAEIIPPQELQVEGGTLGTDYTYRGNELTVLTETPMKISMVPGVTETGNYIQVKLADKAGTANLMLSDVSINTPVSGAAALRVISGKLNLTLADGSVNILTSGKNCAGLQNGNNELLIHCEGAGTEGHACSEECGKLLATGDHGAGIGGGHEGDGSNISITGGNVSADGDSYAAGIGGGQNGDGSNISITGGNVSAVSSSSGAGIGGGYKGNGSSISVSGGTVAVQGGQNGAGIGGGYRGNGSSISVSGGTVTVRGGKDGAGIGGGFFGGGSQISILGGIVEAVAGNGEDGESEGIGGGAGFEGKDIILNPSDGMQIAAQAGEDAEHVAPLSGSPFTSETEITDLVRGKAYFISKESAVLRVSGGEQGKDYTYNGGVLKILTETPMTISNLEGVVTADHIEVDLDSEKAANITLAGVNIDTSDAYEAAALQVISGKLNLTLADGSVNTLRSGEECAGLQNDEHELLIRCEGAGPEGHSCDANCGALTAAGGDGAAGIGGGNWMNGENITILGGAVTAAGGSGGAGIGGGDRRGNGNNITILGGTVTASAGYGAGIGGGSGRDAGDILISGGTVTATSGDGAGIGGGHWGKADGIHISGGTVTASGGEASAGIGSSAWSDGSDITISGGTVTAAGGENGAGIGGGQYGNGVNITISGGMVTAKRGENAAAIGGGDSAESTDTIISGGLFGEGDAAANTVYGITPPDGHRVLANPDTNTSADYPVGVYTEDNAAVTLKDAVVAFDGAAVEAGDLTFTAQYGSTAARAEDYEWYYSTDGEEWTGGLPVNVGSYTMRLTVKEKLSEEVFYLKASATASLTVEKGEQKKPEGVKAVDVSRPGKKDGKLTGLTSGMEYKRETDKEWTPAPGSEVTGLGEGTYLVRYKETENYKAGAPLELVIKSGTVSPAPADPKLPKTPSKVSSSRSPRTGDNTAVSFWLALAGVSALGVITMLSRRRKNK